MQCHMICSFFVFLLFVGVSACHSAEKRTKVYNDSITRTFRVICSEWDDEKKTCRFVSESGSSYIDSVIYKIAKNNGLIKKDRIGENHDSRGYFNLFERIYDDEDFLAYVYMNTHGYEYNLAKYSRGRLTYKEFGCDTLQSFYKEDCQKRAQAKNASVDSNGRYVFYKETIVWDSLGRLKQRELWYSNDVLELNSSYTYIYGSPCDSVRVDPVDYPMNFYAESGVYDGSYGLMPEIQDPEYEEFAKDPYEFEATPELLERQKKRCEDYKKSLKKGNGTTR